MPNQSVCRDCGCDLTQYNPLEPATCPGCGGLNPTKESPESEAGFYVSSGFEGVVLKSPGRGGAWVHCKHPSRIQP